MLAHSSITQADSRKLDQNCCLNSGQLLAGRAQEQVAAGLAVLIAHFADRDVAFFRSSMPPSVPNTW